MADPAGVPTHRALAADALDHFQGQVNMLALFVFGDVAVIQPTITVPGHFVACIA
ncbi:hypothetical protein D3C76_1725450 [compost metagenome]